MPRLVGVREQLGEFARPYPYPYIRQPAPLGEFARPYPYPYIRQPVPLGNVFEDIYGAAKEAASSVYNAVVPDSMKPYIEALSASNICGPEAQSQIRQLSTLKIRYSDKAREAKVALDRSTPSFRSKRQSIYDGWTLLSNETKKLLDRQYFWMAEAYKFGVGTCEQYFLNGVGGLGYGVNYGIGVEPVTTTAASVSTIVAYGVVITVGVSLVLAVRSYLTKVEAEAAHLDAQTKALESAIEVTRTACSANPGSPECTQAREFQTKMGRMSADAFDKYAQLEKDREEAGISNTVQTVAIAGVVGLIAFYGLKIIASRQSGASP
jgi:hypothetical protein